MIDYNSLGGKSAALREAKPLVLNVTNYVAMNFSANVLLAAGASPLMSFYPAEMAELVPQCSAVLINIGCIDSQVAHGARMAAEAAQRHGVRWVLDPVGVGASAERKELCRELIENYSPCIIRANPSEVCSLALMLCGGDFEAGGRGADSTLSSDRAVDAARSLASSCNCIVSMSGASDYVTDGERIVRIDGGDPVMPQITAMGCSASALTAAFASLGTDPFEAACTAMEMMAAAGEIAARQTRLPGSFQPAFLDALASIGARRFDPASLKLYLVTDRDISGDRDIVDIVRQAVKGGVTMVQLREKNLGTDAFVALAIKLKTALQPLGVPLIINDRVDVALASDADGVHLGQSDMSCIQARQLLGAGKIIGLSVENMEQVLQANALDIDYIGVSPVFATPTKTDTAAPFGIEGLREAVRLSRHPAVGIGGMNASTAAAVMQAGADGIAVVSAIVGAPDPREAASNLIKVIDDGTERLG